jgi:hypothetical protein
MDTTDTKLQEMTEAQGKTVAEMIVMRKMMRPETDKVLTVEQRRNRHHQHESLRQGQVPRAGFSSMQQESS